MASRVNLKSAVMSLFQFVPDRSSSTELVIVCPCKGCSDSTGNRSINVKTGKTSCWKCNRGYSTFERFCNSLGVNVGEFGVVSTDVDEVEKLSKDLGNQESKLTPIISQISLPSGFKLLADNRGSAYHRLIEKMAIKKKLTIGDLEEYGAGYTMDGSWEPYVIFPVIEWGNVVYYQGRTYGAAIDGKTKKFPSRFECPLGSRYWVYNIDEVRVRGVKTVIVVESILNVISLEKKIRSVGAQDKVAAACVFKHHVSHAQLAKLLALKKLEELCFMYDADSVNASWAEAAKLTNQRVSSVAEIPPVTRTQDANDDVDLAWKAFENRKRTDGPLNQLAALARKSF